MSAAVNDLIVESHIAAVEENGQSHGWPFERVGRRCFRVCLTARTGDVYELEVDCEGFPSLPASFHWRNRQTGKLDDLADSPRPFNFFHGSGRICAPWNRLASTEGGPHLEWAQTSWQHNELTKGTRTLAAMVLRIHHELRSPQYQGRRL